MISTIESTFPVVVTSPTKLRELHNLRIACKKLRYLLELLPDKDKSALKTQKILQKLQDILGTIHDYDFSIEYLYSLGESSVEMQEIIAIEKEERDVKFNEFLGFCKRRLKISPDSFIMSLRKLS